MKNNVATIMKVFITGNRGFIGGSIMAEMNRRGIGFTGYDLRDGHDIRDEFSLTKAMVESGADTVLHLAARAGAPLGERFLKEYVDTNVIGTENVLRAAEYSGIKNIISFSSSSVLGGNADDRPLTEDSTYNVKNTYGMTKMMGEMLAQKGSDGRRVVIVRPFSVYGLNGRSDMVLYRWINRIRNREACLLYGDAKSTRGYTHVMDLARGTVDLIEKIENFDYGCEILHMGGNARISLADFFDIVKKEALECGKTFVVQKSIPDFYWDIRHSFSDCTKAKKMIGWEPERDFELEVRNIVRAELDATSSVKSSMFTLVTPNVLPYAENADSSSA
jgi:UDP-glucuronate 4-epimerase